MNKNKQNTEIPLKKTGIWRILLTFTNSRYFKLILLIVLTCSSLYAAYLFYMVYIINSNTPTLFGSKQNIIDTLQTNEKGDNYKFLLLGDSRGNLPVEEDLIEQVKKEIDFAVILGDAAERNASSHRYLRQSMQELNLKFPFFYVVGNNDIRYTSKKINYQGDFTDKNFEDYYGPLLFSFTYHNDLFISICSIGDKKWNAASLEFLNSFTEKRNKYRHCFVFMHVPPPIPAFESKKFFATKKFISMFDTLKVDYVFASHFHGYQATKYHNINYIITGGAGAPLNSKHLRQFYHAIEFQIGKDFISQRFVYSPEDIDLPDLLKIRTIQHVIPFFQQYPFCLYIITALLAIGWFFLFCDYQYFCNALSYRLVGNTKICYKSLSRRQ